jgi:hypothetical protein
MIMFMAKSINDDSIMAMGETIADVWEELQFSWELTGLDFDDLEWFEVEPITVKRKCEFVIE